MKKLYLALAVVLVPIFASNLEASAQGFSVDKNELPKVEYFKSRKKIQITNEEPEVTDVRRAPKPVKRYVFNVSPLATPPVQTTQVNLPAGTSSGGSQLIYVDNGRPPQAGFESNMNSLTPRNGLPKTRLGVMRTQALSGKVNIPAKLLKKRARTANQTIRKQQRTFTYANNSDNGQVTQNFGCYSKTDLKGEIKTPLKRRELLNRVGK